MESETVFVVVFVAALLALAGAIAFRSFFTYVTVFEYERGVHFRDGRFAGLLEAGRHRLRRNRESVVKLDLRAQHAVVPGQELVTADGVTLRLSLVASYEIADVEKAVLGSENHLASLYIALQLGLREALGAIEIEELLARRVDLGADVTTRASDAAVQLGLRLISVDVRDVMLPAELRRTFGQVVRAKQEGLAALERARGEIATLRSLANAARLIERQPALLQLRTLQQLEGTSGNTVILGLPSSSVPIPIGDGEPELPAEPGDGASPES